MKQMLSPYENRKCSVYLLHGDLTSGQMTGLYKHEKIKGMINIAHGEGFGLPYSRLLVKVCQSQQLGGLVNLTFYICITKSITTKLTTLCNLYREKQWPGVLEKEAMWAHADQGSYKMALRKAFKKHDKMKKQAEELKVLVNDKFSDEKRFELFCKEIIKSDPVEQPIDLEAML